MLQAVNDSSIMATYIRNQESPKPLFTFSGHMNEGFALDWSPTVPGKWIFYSLSLTFDFGFVDFRSFWLLVIVRRIFMCGNPNESDWSVDQRAYIGHTGSVEDIQWSPNEPTVRVEKFKQKKKIRIEFFFHRFSVRVVSIELFVFGIHVQSHQKHVC